LKIEKGSGNYVQFLLNNHQKSFPDVLILFKDGGEPVCFDSFILFFRPVVYFVWWEKRK